MAYREFSGPMSVRSVAPGVESIMRRECPREGDERLSGKARGESDGAQGSGRPAKSADRDKKGKKQRSADLGRALRSVYDDTLRESVPNEFLNILGKLS
jgi:hypothetical protein